MYYSYKEVAPGQNAQLATMPVRDIAPAMLQGVHPEVAFEAAVTTMAALKRFEPAMVANQVLARDTAFARKTVEVGVAEMSKTLGSDAAFRAFLGQVLEPSARIRFVGVFGAQEGMIGARNRAAAMAYVASIDDGQKPAYVDHLRSVHKLVTEAVDKERLSPDDGLAITRSIEKAAVSGLPLAQRAGIEQLHKQVHEALLEEKRQRLRAQYATSRPDDTPTP
ncbi:hypothetical protein [Cupriavidus sp. TMH.W2]|uniref:hypothetical protein n=1 Tax=Cupriavidus sp. TMH.W2 TaxID=3434465 RepID=UPI003D783CFA